MDAEERAGKISACAENLECCAGHENARSFAAEQIRQAEQAARVKALEECRIIASIHSQYPITTDYDRGYDQARKDAAGEIKVRALKET